MYSCVKNRGFKKRHYYPFTKYVEYVFSPGGMSLTQVIVLVRQSGQQSEPCDITALFGIFSETNEHQNLAKLRWPINIFGVLIPCWRPEVIRRASENTLRPRWPPQGVVNSPANVGESMTASYVYYHSTPPVLFNMRRINNSAQCSMKHEPSTVNGAVTELDT